MELEQLVNKIDNTRISVPPLFELFVTTFSIAIAIMFFAYPTMLEDNQTNLYDAMLQIMPQSGWSIAFLIACMIKACGLLLDNNSMRITGLLCSVVIYLIFTICYALNFPTIGMVTFSCMTLFSGISIPFVKHTSITWKRKDGKE